MLDQFGNPLPMLTEHELYEGLDDAAGLRPLTPSKPESVRQPPPFPLAAYLVMVRGE